MSVDYDNDGIINPEKERENRYPEIFSNQKAPFGVVLPVRPFFTEAQPALSQYMDKLRIDSTTPHHEASPAV
ncbi:hypothetical protein CaCOL14_010125 [Colletotrichum acutatum]